jgi:hypothetical protein
MEEINRHRHIKVEPKVTRLGHSMSLALNELHRSHSNPYSEDERLILSSLRRLISGDNSDDATGEYFHCSFEVSSKLIGYLFV